MTKIDKKYMKIWEKKAKIYEKQEKEKKFFKQIEVG